jgi:protein phosphatase methylesterase 1
VHVQTQCEDVLNVISSLYGNEVPAIILVGHSMGGAIAVRVAAKRAMPTLAGLVVVDVVEGTAMASLVHMQRILANRQLHFPSVEKAIEWSVRGGGALRNIESARISVPSTLKYNSDRKCYVWLTPLEESEAHWRGWYEGLSEVFLSCPVPKLLLLAGTDRLDRYIPLVSLYKRQLV